MKPVLWVSSSKRDLVKMPEMVITDFGYALYQAQLGEHPNIAKPLKGFRGSEVLELVADYKSDTFRVVYTVKFPKAIVVLHAFQKKSKKGIATPKKEIDLIKERLKRAEEIYKLWITNGG
ncbi:MAG: hypothetical protein K940chlam7_00130 [Chlamydiae bacterium]|nr:hypothetical protein [Chlamydiota bacterium]